MINSIFIHVGPAPIDITAQNNLLLHASAGFSGGHVFFVGTVRGDEVCAITLEHYPGMTEKALTVIAKKAQKRWNLATAAVTHRVGRLLPGETIVFVGCSSPHRQDAFAACQYIIDRLKTDAPFWKKEETLSGYRWVKRAPADTTNHRQPRE